MTQNTSHNRLWCRAFDTDTVRKSFWSVVRVYSYRYMYKLSIPSYLMGFRSPSLSRKWQIINCQELNFLVRNADPCPNPRVIRFQLMFYISQSILFCWPMYCGMMSPVGPLIWIVYECIFVLWLCVLVHIIICVLQCTYIVIVVGLLVILSLSNTFSILRSV